MKFASKNMLSIFQSATGSCHWPSVISLIAWFVSGCALLTTLYFSREERLNGIAKEMSEYNVAGNRSGSVIGIPMVRTPINNWSEGVIIWENSEVRFKLEAETAKKSFDVINKLPGYPFSYVVLAQFKKSVGDPSWRKDAETALALFDRTIAIPHHHPDHDRFRSVTVQLLEK